MKPARFVFHLACGDAIFVRAPSSDPTLYSTVSTPGDGNVAPWRVAARDVNRVIPLPVRRSFMAAGLTPANEDFVFAPQSLCSFQKVSAEVQVEGHCAARA